MVTALGAVVESGLCIAIRIILRDFHKYIIPNHQLSKRSGQQVPINYFLLLLALLVLVLVVCCCSLKVELQAKTTHSTFTCIKKVAVRSS